MSLSLSKSLRVALIPLAKFLKSSKNSIFSDFGCLFLLVRGVCSKRSFSNVGFFLQEDFFETNLDLSKHPEQVFSIFSYFLNIFFWRKKIILVFGELRELCAKFWKFWVNIHREIICQSRLLLTPFFNFCIVHWTIFTWAQVARCCEKGCQSLDCHSALHSRRTWKCEWAGMFILAPWYAQPPYPRPSLLCLLSI